MSFLSSSTPHTTDPPSHKAFIDSASFCDSFLRTLIAKTFQGVGMENAKRMAPFNTFNQYKHVVESFVGVGFTQEYKGGVRLVEEMDFRPPGIDNLAVQEIESEKGKERSMPTITQEARSTTNSRVKTKKTVTESIRSRKFTQISQKEMPLQTKSKDLSTFEKLPQPTNPYDFSLDPQLNKVRQTHLNVQRENQSRQRQLNELKTKGLIDRQRNEKLAKQTKRLTYDYEGKLFSQGTGMTQPSKLASLTNKFPLNPTKRHTTLNVSRIEPTQIETTRKRDQRGERKEFKEAPMFREKAQSIIETIENGKEGIAAGVKVTEELGENKSSTKENPLKRKEIGSLVEFKNMVKESRFREYHPASLNNKERSLMNASQSFINNEQTIRSQNQSLTKPAISSLISNNNPKPPSFSNRQSKSKSSYSLLSNNPSTSLQQEFPSTNHLDSSILVSIDQHHIQPPSKVKYRGLPFIKTKGYKAIDIDSEKSFKLVLDGKGEEGRRARAKRSRVVVLGDVGVLGVGVVEGV